MRAMPTFNLEAFWASVENWIALHPGSFLAIFALTAACAFIALIHNERGDWRDEMQDTPPPARVIHIRRMQIPVQDREQYAAMVEQCKQRAVDAKASEQRAVDSLPRAQAEMRAILAKRRSGGNEAA